MGTSERYVFFHSTFFDFRFFVLTVSDLLSLYKNSSIFFSFGNYRHSNQYHTPLDLPITI